MTEPMINDGGTLKTVDQWLKGMVLDLHVDAAWMHHFVGNGKSFGFRDQALIDYVKLAIRTVLEAGAIPVWGGRRIGHDWQYQPQYGSTHDDIIKNVVAEWLAEGGGDDGSAVWFAHPDYEDIDIAPKEQRELS